MEMRSGTFLYVVECDDLYRCELISIASTCAADVREYTAAEEFLEEYDDEGLQPRCLITAKRLPQMSGLELQRRLHEEAALIPVILLTAKPDLRSAVDSMKRGAINVLEKPVQPDDLIKEIEYGLTLDARRRTHRRKVGEYQERVAELSPREREVFELVVQGKSIKEVAGILQVGFQTVSKHRTQVFRKLKVRNETELVRLNTLLDSRLPIEAVPDHGRQFTTREGDV